MTTHDSESQKPWFKQFWFLFVFFIPALAVVASLTTVVIAFNGQDPLVADDWYKEGLAINQQLEKTQTAIKLGLKATLEVDHLTGNVAVELQSDTAIATDTLQLSLYHPTLKNRDQTITLKLSPQSASPQSQSSQSQSTRQSQQRYQGELSQSIEGRYSITLEPANQSWRIQAAISNAANQQQQSSSSITTVNLTD